MTVENLDIKEGQETVTDEDQQQINEDLKELGVETKPPVVKDESHEESDEEREAREHDEDNSDSISEEEREAIRERRRKERANKKKFRQDKEESYKREIDTLRQQLGEVNEWKNTVEQRRVQSGAAQLDKALRDSQDAIEIAKTAIREATETQNGAALVDAQELYYAARKRVDELGRVKQQFQQRMQQPPKQNIDPNVVKHAQSWMQGKEWYDPSGRDADSRVALTIDNALAEEGWNPREQAYWEELDSRLKKYLPHRYNVGYTERKREEAGRPPTGGSSQNRGSTSSSGFTLSPERVRAMKEAGLWDDAEKRKTMTKRYMEMDRNGNK